MEQDRKITEQIRALLNTEVVAGIDQIDAICLVAPAGNPRHTPTQRYVIDKILSMFGKDMKKNISVLFTFAYGQKPQALSAMIEDEVIDKDSVFFKFNNSALFADNSGADDEDSIDQMLWRMGDKSFEMFFCYLAKTETRSLVLTKEVLEEIVRQEKKVSELLVRINGGIRTLSRLQEEKRILSEHSAAINANRNFKYTVAEEKRVMISMPSGYAAINCKRCNNTCTTGEEGVLRFSLSISKMFEGEGPCSQCQGNCRMSDHQLEKYRIETQSEEVEREYDGKKALYNHAVQEKREVEAIINQLQEEFNETQAVVLQFVVEMQRSAERLSEIALRKDPLQQVDYLDLLIQSEKLQERPGWKDRTKFLTETRKRAEQINRLTRPGYDPWKEHREDVGLQELLDELDDLV